MDGRVDAVSCPSVEIGSSWIVLAGCEERRRRRG